MAWLIKRILSILLLLITPTQPNRLTAKEFYHCTDVAFMDPACPKEWIWYSP